MNKSVETFMRIMKDYSKYEYKFNDGQTQCFPEENPICIQINIKKFLKCTENVVFDLLHEIGHAQTFDDSLSRCAREFEATTWAINHAKKYGIKISDSRKKEFQDDLFYWKKFEKKCQGQFGLKKTKIYSDKKLQLNRGAMSSGTEDMHNAS